MALSLWVFDRNILQQVYFLVSRYESYENDDDDDDVATSRRRT